MANPDLEYFEKSDKDLLKPFREYHETHGLDYDEKTLKQIAKHGYEIVMAHKKYYNRPRPAQVNPEIKAVKTNTAETPAYPSGHAFQSFMLAKHLGKKYPKHKRKFYEMAHRIYQEFQLDYIIPLITKKHSHWLIVCKFYIGGCA